MRKNIFLIAFILCAILLPRAAFSSDPMVRYLCELGRALYCMEKYDESLKAFHKVLLLEPNNLTAKKYINDIFTKMSGKPVKEKPPAVKPLPKKKVAQPPQAKEPAKAGTVIQAAPPLAQEIKERQIKEAPPEKVPAYKISLQRLISEAERNIQKIDDQMRKQESKVKPAQSTKKEQAIEKQLSDLERRKQK